MSMKSGPKRQHGERKGKMEKNRGEIEREKKKEEAEEENKGERRE